MTDNQVTEIADAASRRVEEVLDGVRVAMLITDTATGLEASKVGEVGTISTGALPQTAD